MKKIISITLVILMLLFTACGKKREISIVKSETPEKLVELKLPGELERENISLLAFDDRYRIFAVNRNTVKQSDVLTSVETAEIIVFDTQSEKTVLYKNLDLSEAVVCDALYYNDVLYYSVIDTGESKAAVNMLDGFDTKEIYGFDLMFSGYSFGDVEFFVQDGKPAFACTEDNGKEFIIENGAATEFESEWWSNYDIDDMIKDGDELIYFHKIGDMVFVYTGNAETGKELAVKHLPSEASGHIDYMACDYIKSNKKDLGFFIQWDGTSSRNKWYNKIDVNDMTVTITKLESPVDLGRYNVTAVETGENKGLFLVNNPDTAEYKLLIYR